MSVYLKRKSFNSIFKTSFSILAIVDNSGHSWTVLFIHVFFFYRWCWWTERADGLSLLLDWEECAAVLWPWQWAWLYRYDLHFLYTYIYIKKKIRNEENSSRSVVCVCLMSRFLFCCSGCLLMDELPQHGSHIPVRVVLWDRAWTNPMVHCSGDLQSGAASSSHCISWVLQLDM